MSQPVKILAFSGSTRKDSYNQKLVTIAAEGARAAGAEVTLISLRDYPLPLYDQDLQAASGIPAAALELKKLFQSHQGLLLASPEYNSSYSAVLKNTLDWVSRPNPADPKEPALGGLANKVAAIMATSPGALGGMRVLVPLRMLLANLNMIVLPNQIALPKAHEIFDEAGNLRDAKQQEAVRAIGKSLAEVVGKL